MLRPMNLTLKFGAVLLTASLFTGCATLGSYFKGGRKSEAATADSVIPSDAVVVMRAGKRLPVVSPLERKAWVELHQDSKSGPIKFNSALAAGEYSVAISEAKSHLQRFPRSESALTALAVGHVLKKNFGLALFYARLLKKFHPNSSHIKNIEGVWTITQPKLVSRDYRNAAQLFEEAVSQGGNNIAASLNLGNLYLELGQADRASEIYATAKGRCGGCIEARYGLGIALTRLGQPGPAKAEFEAILDNDDQEFEALYRLALVAKNGYNDHKQAKEYLSKLLDSANPKDPIYRQGYIFMRRLQSLKDPSDSRIANNKNSSEPETESESEDAELLKASLKED